MALNKIAPPIGSDDLAPDFALPAHTGEIVRLHEVVATGPVVLYFYPKDNTLGCTAEACAFRDSHGVFVGAGAQVLGISADSVASHRTFATRHNLPFRLLSDSHNAVRRLYGVPATLGLLPGRVTYVIDRAGRVRTVFSSQIAATRHIDEALETVRALVEGRSIGEA